MARVLLFGLIFTAGALAWAAGKAEKADTADQVAKVAKPDKPDKPDKAVKADKPDPQSAYKALLQERDQLKQQKKILEWEEDLAAASMQDSTAYLVVDLYRRQVTAKLGGVPLRHAPILWRYERPGQAAATGIFQVAQRRVTLPDSAVYDSAQALSQPAVAAVDSAATDSSKAALIAPVQRGPAPRRYDPEGRYCLSLQGGPDLWLATLPPAQSRMDTLEIRLRAWARDFPAVVQHRQSIYLFLSPADNHWIYAMAVLGARVLVIPPS